MGDNVEEVVRRRHGIPEEAIAEAELAHAPEDREELLSSPWRLRERLATHGAIGAGGLLGANARYFMGVWAANRWGTAFPWGTFAINIAGSFLLGFYLTLVTERFTGRAVTRLFVATGFLGAFTTFSTFGYETVTLLQDGSPVRALSYVVASLVVGITGVIAGILAAHRLSGSNVAR
ncbi:MAG TPA: fluoride efflux transporter CrcB [Thermomicrobiales bacterium]|nr:fluoride efflux transporter CrcB [Thermomicrobiales bacterium]